MLKKCFKRGNMKGSSERLSFIASYISAYKQKIELLNHEGLFDEAKLFELFAIEVGSLIFNTKLTNLNIDTFTYPAVDLVSEDGSLYVQVSTSSDIPGKIKYTLEKIKDSKKQELKTIKKVKFIVLANESIVKVKDYVGDNRIGNVDFVKSDDLITTDTILHKASTDLDFQIKLYELLKSEEDSVQSNLASLEAAVEDSKAGIENIDCCLNEEYVIDRSVIIEQIKSDNYKNICIQGEAGSGKSALCKLLLKDTPTVLYARAERFLEESTINNIWGFNVRDTFELLEKRPIVIFVDALEFIADNRSKLDLLYVLYDCAQKYDFIKIVTSCRASDKSAFLKLEGNFSVKSYNLSYLTIYELEEISNKYKIINKLLKISSYQKLLVNPLYLNIILKNITDINHIEDENQFREYIWDKIICNNNDQYRQVINDIAFKRAKTASVGVNIDLYNRGIIQSLISLGILIKNGNSVRLKYDLFEDICFERYFDAEFDKCKGNYNEFFHKINELGASVYRRYQIWIENKLMAKANRDKFLYELIFSDKIPKNWFEQTQIGLVKSRYSDEFFREYGDIIFSSGLLDGFIAVTNLYAFELDNKYISKYLVVLNPSGVGRKNLIHLIAKNMSWLDGQAKISSVIRLCEDGSRQYSDDEACAKDILYIISSYIDSALSFKNGNGNEDMRGNIKDLLLPIYNTVKFNQDWITKFWLSVKELYQSKINNQIDFAEQLIEYTLQARHVLLAQYIPNELCDLAELFWAYNPTRQESPWAFEHIYDNMNAEYKYGLSRMAENYSHDVYNKSVQNSAFFFTLLRKNFWLGLDWIIHFVNECITKFNNENSLYSYEIITNEGVKRRYLGRAQMWLATTQQYSLPILLADLVYSLKCVCNEKIKNFLKSKKDPAAFANKVKEIIFTKSNNIVLLTVVSEIGMTYWNILPIYAIEIITNIDLVQYDISRYATLISDPTKEMIENSIYEDIGLPNKPAVRYAEVLPKMSLIEYMQNQIFYGNDLIRNKCYKVLDFLYSIIPNDDEHAQEYLQIQKMDFRTAEIKDKNTFLEISPKITGAAKKLTEHQEMVNIADQKINAIVKDMQNKLINKKIETYDLIAAIEEIEKLQPKCFIPIRYENVIISLISAALCRKDLSLELRNKYCDIWVYKIDNLLSRQGLYYEFDPIEVLFNQLKENVNLIIKNKIKTLMLEAILYQGQNGLVSKLGFYVYKWLYQNEQQAVVMFNTILQLAEDEMLHQKFNADYLKTHNKDNNYKFSFKPNYQAKLIGVDEKIRANNEKLYSSKANEIIKDYLYQEEEVEICSFNIQSYDIGTLFCGLNCMQFVSGENLKNIVKVCVNELININHYVGSYHGHCILNVFQESKIQGLLKRTLLYKDNGIDIIFDIMFDNVDFSIFENETVRFYQEVFGGILPYYFDSYNNAINRRRVESIIYKLEDRVNAITVEKIKIDLYKSLIMYPAQYILRSDWSQYNAEYSYCDTQFLNRIFERYGYYHFDEMLDVIYKLHYDKLLPWILISLSKTMNKINDDMGSYCFEKLIAKNYDFIIRIITRAFLDFNSSIKTDDDLNKSFEEILLMLRYLNYPEAAVLLDEFRVH